MKCPKCGYLGFEHVERCRNCGYDFSLTLAAPIPDLPIRGDTHTSNPLDDLTLVDRANARRPAPASDNLLDLDRALGVPAEPVAAPQQVSVRRASIDSDASRQELPLFGPPIPDDEPLITKASPPRSPLAVRRATSDVPKGRTEQARMPSLDLGLDLDAPAAAPRAPELRPAARAEDTVRIAHDAYSRDDRLHRADSDTAADAGVGLRLAAVLIDLLILAVIDAAVVYFTMQICGIGVDDIDILPKVPLLAFLLVQNGGYFVAFTAAGQTLGKMAVGIRIVPAGDAPSVDLGRAFVRTLLWLVLAVPVGLGFLTALFSPDRRGLHDRFAGTRVVRASM
jgi:uncharacterized RDD family membrane protein YckC